jgi:uncharacterized protein (UPF0212 family)
LRLRWIVDSESLPSPYIRLDAGWLRRHIEGGSDAMRTANINFEHLARVRLNDFEIEILTARTCCGVCSASVESSVVVCSTILYTIFLLEPAQISSIGG